MAFSPAISVNIAKASIDAPLRISALVLTSKGLKVRLVITPNLKDIRALIEPSAREPATLEYNEEKTEPPTPKAASAAESTIPSILLDTKAQEKTLTYNLATSLNDGRWL